MKTFKDLEFKQHKVIPKAVQARLDFENGTFISVVGGESLYGNGITSFEIMSNVTQRTKRGVEGWLSKDQITRRMIYLQKTK
jgi:hypothetical protein